MLYKSHKTQSDEQIETSTLTIDSPNVGNLDADFHQARMSHLILPIKLISFLLRFWSAPNFSKDTQMQMRKRATI